MPKATHRLTAIKAANTKAVGMHPDGAGLYLKVDKCGSRSWVFRYMRERKPRYLGLGSAASVSLATARSLASDARRQLDLGQDPIEAKRLAEKEVAADKARSMTFKECAEAYMAAHEPSWKNAKHCEQWHSTLRRYLYPKFGGIAVSSVTTVIVLDAIQPIWHSMPETASRVRGRIEVVIDWAKARGAFSGENPARWRGHLANLLPKPSKVAKVEHHAAMPFDDLPAFVSELRATAGLTSRALEFTILTAARTTEALGARWTEFDLGKKLWTVPGARMKSGKEHRVPLSPRSVEIVKELETVKQNEFVFPGEKPGRHLSNMSMLMLLRRMKRSDLTVHGFRSTFRDWAAETTNFPNFVVEMALAHAISDGVEAAYRRGDLSEKRRVLMGEWDRYCAKTIRKADQNFGAAPNFYLRKEPRGS
ncbi:tyrosine-type recombinase/integrase [Hyphomicrobium facile]|uniref:Integrase n=1 Tax=Hyphomicrobium facile TaxID=51670 RepID=A0A1I7NVK0_9HYPH|nr:site-specific integrase [Hyphomicrobium facile]SFV38701.1 Integrase [Hyphomicrobium facile]